MIRFHSHSNRSHMSFYFNEFKLFPWHVRNTPSITKVLYSWPELKFLGVQYISFYRSFLIFGGPKYAWQISTLEYYSIVQFWGNLRRFSIHNVIMYNGFYVNTYLKHSYHIHFVTFLGQYCSHLEKKLLNSLVCVKLRVRFRFQKYLNIISVYFLLFSFVIIFFCLLFFPDFCDGGEKSFATNKINRN